MPPRRTRPSLLRAIAPWVLAAAACAAPCGPVFAQWLPSGPVTAAGGRLVLSGDASISMSTSDHHTYFNYGDYQYDLMRLVRLGLAATLRLGSRTTVVADVRVEGDLEGGSWRAYPITLALGVRPIAGSSLAVEAGIVQPAFGAFATRRYGADNLLIGYPLAFQYTTGVRADAIPATADEVLANRGRGWAPHYSIGSTESVSGLSLVNTSGWSPGLSVAAGAGRFSGRVAVTQGGLAAAGSADWQNRWSVTGRVEARPVPSIVAGVSAAYGAFVDDALSSVVATAAFNRTPRERAFGADVEYSRGYWLVRAETVVSSRTYPAFAPPYLRESLRTVAVEAEARYKLRPGLYAAARIGRLVFGSVEGSSGTTGWDADVTRLETGLGYSFTRNVLVKTVYQYNRRDSERSSSLHLGAAQLVVRF